MLIYVSPHYFNIIDIFIFINTFLKEIMGPFKDFHFLCYYEDVSLTLPSTLLPLT